ncbi:HAD hydrolase-like protein [Chthonobacter albigriseus]|uniref:HAD hydrolase-like protein n=1 Tax=Chthonobacter albigriseus TaxID=1683161 RepID=UPI0015EED2B4|nr:HAD hydrolase-like protein [Chthonobacter albigriseus]
MSIRLAIFDFDGTLADSADWVFSTMNSVADRFGFRRVAPEEREELRGLSNREIIARLGVPMWKLPLIAAHMRKAVAADIDAIRPFPWTADLIGRIHAGGCAVGIVTSNAAENVARILGPETMARVARVEADASLYGKARKLSRMTAASGVDPASAVAIGDEVRDVEAAREAGIRAVAVTWGLASEAALARALPDAWAHSPDDLARLILG